MSSPRTQQEDHDDSLTFETGGFWFYKIAEKPGSRYLGRVDYTTNS